MNFANLRLFLTVAESETMSEAAKRLGTSQQNVSNHISRLEDELGAELFVRSPVLKLTYAGSCAKERAVQILQMEQDMRRQLEEIGAGQTQRLRIGTSTTRGRMLLANLLVLFHETHPETELDVQLSPREELIQKLSEGKLDLVAGVKPEDAPASFSYETIEHTRLCLLLPKDMLPQDVSPDEVIDSPEKAKKLADLKYLVHSAGSPLRMLTDRYFSKNGLEPRVMLEINSLDLLNFFATQGMGVAVSFENYARRILADENLAEQVCLLPIDDPALESEFVIARNEKFFLGRAAADFIALARRLKEKINLLG